MKKPDFLYVGTNSLKLSLWKNTGMDLVINACVHSSCRNLKLAASHKEINEMNWFLMF